MKADDEKLMLVAAEIAGFLRRKGARRIECSYDFRDESPECRLAAAGFVLPADEFAHILKSCAGPLQPELSNYYGNLSGKKDDGSGIDLLGAIAAFTRIASDAEEGTVFVFST